MNILADSADVHARRVLGCETAPALVTLQTQGSPQGTFRLLATERGQSLDREGSCVVSFFPLVDFMLLSCHVIPAVHASVCATVYKRSTGGVGTVPKLWERAPPAGYLRSVVATTPQQAHERPGTCQWQAPKLHLRLKSSETRSSRPRAGKAGRQDVEVAAKCFSRRPEPPQGQLL